MTVRPWCLAALGAGLALGALPAQAGEPTPVRITVTNVRDQGGVLLVGAYDRPDDWLGERAAHSAEVPVGPNLRGGSVTVELRLPPGRYGVSLFQDLNGNRRLDTNFRGIPKEASGASNNPPARWGPPKFTDALVTVGEAPLALTIRLE